MGDKFFAILPCFYLPDCCFLSSMHCESFPKWMCNRRSTWLAEAAGRTLPKRRRHQTKRKLDAVSDHKLAMTSIFSMFSERSPRDSTPRHWRISQASSAHQLSSHVRFVPVKGLWPLSKAQRAKSFSSQAYRYVILSGQSFLSDSSLQRNEYRYKEQTKRSFLNCLWAYLNSF